MVCLPVVTPVMPNLFWEKGGFTDPQVTKFEFVAVGLNDLTNTTTGHNFASTDGISIGCALHPGAVGRVLTQQNSSDNNLTNLRLGNFTMN